MKYQKEILLKPYSRGFHLITNIIEDSLESVLDNIKIGLLQVFIKHTSASLTINENADRTVRNDMDSFYNDIVSENKPYYTHVYEGEDDMPAHIKNSIISAGKTCWRLNDSFDVLGVV